MENNKKQYFDLTADDKNIFDLSIKIEDIFTCQLVDSNSNFYDGFILARTPAGNNLTVCDINFHKSNADKKYQARLIFRKTDNNFKNRNVNKGSDSIIISFKTGQEGYREFLQMIAFLYKWRETIDLGNFDDVFAVTEKNLLGVLPAIAKLENKDLVLNNLQKLSKDELLNIDNLVNVTTIKNLLKEWEENKYNPEEFFWQTFFENNNQILSQIFASPFIFIEGQFFCGGKKGSNIGGIEADFVFKNELTQNTAFIEIKTPKIELVQKSLYLGISDEDNNAIYSISPKLTGGVNEVLNQKNIFIQKKDSLEESEKQHFNFKCIVIAGTMSDLSKGQIKSFELYRSSLSGVEIVTYDELFNKTKTFLTIFEKK